MYGGVKSKNVYGGVKKCKMYVVGTCTVESKGMEGVELGVGGGKVR